MSLGDELQRRLLVYGPYRCEDWDAFRATIGPETPLREIWLQLPGFRNHPGQVFGRKLFDRWLRRQLALAAKAAQRSGE